MDKVKELKALLVSPSSKFVIFESNVGYIAGSWDTYPNHDSVFNHRNTPNVSNNPLTV